jgi:hypothetical protein
MADEKKGKHREDGLSLLCLMAGVSVDRFTAEEQKRLRRALAIFLQSVKDRKGPPE